MTNQEAISLLCQAQAEIEWTQPMEYAAIDKAIEVLELLKEQEPIVPIKVNRYMDINENGEWYIVKTYDCGNCKIELPDGAYYCPRCGKAVKWE